jgi:hypothetical protein
VETSLSLFALLHQWKLPTQLLVWFQIFVYFNSIDCFVSLLVALIH